MAEFFPTVDDTGAFVSPKVKASVTTTIRAEVGAQMGPAATDAVEAAAEGLDLVTTARVPITIPAGLGWDTYTLAPTIAAALGTEGTHGDVGVTAAGLFDRHSTARTAPGAEFWVATTGSDAAAGTQAAPFRTIGKAIQAGNAAGVPTRVNVQAGVYQRTEGIYRSSADKPAVDLALVAVGGRVVTGLFDQLTLTADATHTNTYSAALGNCDRVLDLTTRNQYGIHPDITNVPTAAACNARPGSWAIEGGRLYVNRYDGAVPTPTNTRIYRHANSPFVVDAPVNVYVEGLDLSGGERGAMWAEPAGSTPWATPRVLVCASTTFRYAGYVAAPYARGMTVDSWNGLAAFFNCDASGNASDGFNVHNNKKATKVRLLTVNCSGNDNGRGMALSCQGATIHADVVWIDVAGSYRGNRGGNIFNVNTSRALLAGTYSANDRGDVIYGGIIDPTGIRCGGGATIWCDRTIVDQPRGTFAYFAEGTGTIHKRRTPPVPQPDAGAGTFATY